MKFMNQIYVVDVKEGEVVNTAANEKALAKRLSLLKEPYSEDVKFLRVAKSVPLTTLDTDERIGYDYFTTLFTAAIVADVTNEQAVERAIARGYLEEVTVK